MSARRSRDPLGWLRPLGLVSAVMWCGLVACVTEYDLERDAPERESLGNEVFKVVRKDALRSPRDGQARAAMLDRERSAFVGAIDTIATDPWLEPLEDYLLALLPLHDSGLTAQSSRRVADLLDACAQDDALRDVWARDNLGVFPGYRHEDVRSAWVERALGFEQLRALTQWLARLVLDHDGLGDDGAANAEEPKYMGDLIALLSHALRTAEVDPDPNRVDAQATDLLLRTDPTFDAEGDAELWVVRIDARGLPIVETLPGSDRLYFPFVDEDGDGLADADAQGRFVDRDGSPLDVVPFGEPNARGAIERDAMGRAVVDGRFLFAYVDLNATAGAHLMRDSASLIEDEVFFDLVAALRAVLPERVPATDAETGLTYEAYPEDHPLMDLMWAVTRIGAVASLDELLDLSAMLLDAHPEVLAEVLLALQEFGDLTDADPSASLADNNTFVDDLLALLVEIASFDGLLEEVLGALRDDVSPGLEPSLIELLSHKGTVRIPADAPYERCMDDCEELAEVGTVERLECIRACPRDLIFYEPMDYSAPPSETNRSHFERMLALLREAAGLPFELKVERLVIPDLGSDYDIGPDVIPPLVRIDDAGEAYMEALAGNLVLEDYITPEALEDPTIPLLLDGVEFICDSESFFSRFAASLLERQTRVVRSDLDRTCGYFDAIAADDTLDDETRLKKRITVMAAFLSVLSDAPLDLSPTVRQLTRFFNLPSPSLDLELVQLELSPLVDKDGYVLYDHNGDMLFAAEASGSLDILYPIVKAFSDRGQSALFVRLLETLYLHWPAPGVTYPKEDGTPSETFQSGLQTYQPAILAWLEQGRLIPALTGLAQVGGSLESARGRDFDAVTAEVVRHLITPDPALTHRDGRTESLRADGATVAPISPIYVLDEALDGLDARLAADAEAEARWDRAVDRVADALIEVEADPETGAARWAKPAGIRLAALLTRHLHGRAAAHRDAGVWRDKVTQEWYGDARDALGGPTLAATMDLIADVDASPEDRALMTDLLLYSVGDPQGVQDLLVHAYTLALEATAQDDFVVLASFYGELLGAERAWGEGAGSLPLVSQGMLLLRESDAVDVDGVALEFMKQAVTRRAELEALDGDPAGAYPITALANVIRAYHRVDPSRSQLPNASSYEPMDAADYAQVCGDVRDWLLDDREGMEQVYDLLESR